MEKKVYFTKERLAERVIQFTDVLGYRANLVLGDQKALLFDTMCGVGNLKAEVKAVTDLPVTVVLSHNHFDHIGGAFLYDEVWISASEQETVNAEIPHLQAAYQAAKEGGLLDETELHAFKDGKMPNFLTLSEGHTFDLGGISFRAVALPGHTEGSMGLLSEDAGLLMVGDAMTPIMCLFFDNSLSVEAYLATLAKAEQLSFSYFLTSHHRTLFPKACLVDFLNCARFALSDRGMNFQHDMLPEFRGTLHIYRGNSSDDDDFLALIEKCIPRIHSKNK